MERWGLTDCGRRPRIPHREQLGRSMSSTSAHCWPLNLCQSTCPEYFPLHIPNLRSLYVWNRDPAAFGYFVRCGESSSYCLMDVYPRTLFTIERLRRYLRIDVSPSVVRMRWRRQRGRGPESNARGLERLNVKPPTSACSLSPKADDK